MNIGTFRSAVHEYAFGDAQVKIIRRRLYDEVFEKPLPVPEKKLKVRKIPFRNKNIEGLNVEMPSCDKHVVYRTQRHCFDEFDEEPVQLETYATIPGFGSFLKFLSIGAIFGFLTFFGWGRSLLEKYPHIFTFGYFNLNGPSREQLDSTGFTTTLIGQGWSEKREDSSKQARKAFNKEVILQVKGKDPAYRATSTFLVQAALTILLEREQMPQGGVLTPAFAFHNTHLVERLQEYGIDFTIQ